MTSTPTASKDGARPRLYLVDGYSNIFRAFYAIRNLTNTKGEPTNAVFGFLQMLRKLLRDEQPEYLGIAMDVSEVTKRKERYDDYKANRKPMPEDLRPQIDWIRELVTAYRIPLLEMPGYEADDVLGTLGAKASADGFDVVLVSPDKDLMQLVGDGVYMHHTGRDKLYDAQGIEEDFGVPPHQVVDVLALQGDASDNVPGVPGIGEKGAKTLVKEYGSVEALLEEAQAEEPRIKRKAYREGLRDHRDAALLSKELVTIHTDLEIDFEPEALRLEEPDLDELLALCRRFDFQQVARELESEHGGAKIDLVPAEELVDEASWSAFARSVAEAIAADETAAETAADEASADPIASLAVATLADPPMGLACRLETGEADADTSARMVYVDFRRDGLEEAARASLRTWLATPGLRLVGHQLKEAVRFASAGGGSAVDGARLTVSCDLVDTMLLSYVTRSALRSHEFEPVVSDRLQRSAMSLVDAGFSNRGADKGQPPMVGDGRLALYAAERVGLPAAMAERMEQELEEHGDLAAVYERFEAPLVPVLAAMEERGVLLDCDFLAAMSSELGDELEGVEREIYEIAGETFNLNSPKQLGEVMFETLGYPVVRKTRKTKSWSTDAETLAELANQGYDLATGMLRYRELSKLKATYVDALPELVDAEGRVHTRFNQAVAQTGRLSSSQPNLQNIPVRTELGQRIRKAFRATPGMRLVVADYSQIELRLLAHVAEEERMIEAFRTGEDIHVSTAAAVLGIMPGLVNPDQRRMAKTINFGIVYGMTAFGLSRELGIERKDAQAFIDAYMERYPGVARYTEATLEGAFADGEVTTLYGRIRQVPEIRSRNYGLRENAKRMAINAPIQGTAADLLKEAMITVERRLARDMPAARLLLTVHDELVLEGPEDETEALGVLLRDAMEGVADLAVPLVVDVGIGETWYDAKV